MFDVDKEEFYDGEVIAEYKEISNKEVTIELYLPCGMALQSMQWKDSNDILHRYHLSENGYGFSGEIILSR